MRWSLGRPEAAGPQPPSFAQASRVFLAAEPIDCRAIAAPILDEPR